MEGSPDFSVVGPGPQFRLKGRDRTNLYSSQKCSSPSRCSVKGRQERSSPSLGPEDALVASALLLCRTEVVHATSNGERHSGRNRWASGGLQDGQWSLCSTHTKLGPAVTPSISPLRLNPVTSGRKIPPYPDWNPLPRHRTPWYFSWTPLFVDITSTQRKTSNMWFHSYVASHEQEHWQAK